MWNHEQKYIVKKKMKIQDSSCGTMSKIHSEKKIENPRFYEQSKLLFWQLTLQPLDSFGGFAICRSSSIIQEKQIYNPLWTKVLYRFIWSQNLLGVFEKLEKYVDHLSKRKIIIKISSH
jgi:hypothetical protein